MALDYWKPLECDVAIAGAEMAAMVAAAILARRGKRVIVVDTPPQVGGRGGATPFRGYWLDGGHRDGQDVTDLEIAWYYGQQACKEADVEVRLRPMDAHLRVHLMPEFPPRGPAPTVNGDWSPEGFVPLARDVYGVPESMLGDYAKLLERIAGASRDEIDANVEVTLADWARRNAPQPELQRAVLMMAKTIYCQYPERASAGRIMGFFSQRHRGEPIVHGFADDEEAGGMQGAIAPFERAFRRRGGQVILDHKPLEVLIEDGRAVGLLAVNANHLALEIRAPQVIVSYPIWAALPLIPPQHVDPELVQISRGLEDSGTDGIGLQIGLRRLPRLRSSGEVETHRGWNRMFIGPERHFRGGWHIASMSSQRVAPPGKHLLHCLITRWLRKDERLWWRDTRAWAEAARAYLGTFYADFDECVEWQSYQYMARPGMMGWFWAPVRRHGIRVPRVRNLYFANTTIESDASPVDISAHAGLEAARAVLQDAG